MVCLEFQALEMGCHCDKSNILCVSHRRSQFYDRLVLNGKVCVIYVAQTPHIRERESIDTFKSFLTTQNDPVRWSVGCLCFGIGIVCRIVHMGHCVCINV